VSGYGRTWWGKRWLRTVEQLGITYPDSRMSKARTLARAGAVDLLTIDPGELSAWVDQPRRSFGVSVRLPVFDTAQWNAVDRTLAEQLRNLADLLDDRLPTTIDKQLSMIGLSLFPADGELDTYCPCKDSSAACVHVIAVQHAFAARFDDDPFLLPLLRGRDHDAFLAGLRAGYPRPPAGRTPTERVAVTALSADDYYERNTTANALLMGFA